MVADTIVAELKKIQVSQLTVLLDLDMGKLNAKLSIRKKGSNFKQIPNGTIINGKQKVIIDHVEQFIGKEGELPEFELTLTKPGGGTGGRGWLQTDHRHCGWARSECFRLYNAAAPESTPLYVGYALTEGT